MIFENAREVLAGKLVALATINDFRRLLGLLPTLQHKGGHPDRWTSAARGVSWNAGPQSQPDT